MAPQSAMASSQNINEEADHNCDWETWKKVDGIKFKPTAEVLIFVYLAGMVSGSTDGPIFPLIHEVDVYQDEPSKLKSKAHDFGDGNMYFFSRVQKKYKKGSICDRKAKGGFWKTGKCKTVRGKDGGRGTERSLIYHRLDPESGEKPIKTHWLMREYMLPERPKNDKESMALCVVYFHGQRDNEDKQSSHPDLSSYSYSNMPNIGSCVIDINNASRGSIATAPNNNFPLHSSNLNPAASTPELPSSNSFQNINNMMGVSSAALAESNINTPNNCCSTLAELDPQNWVVAGLEADGSQYQYSNDDIQPLDQYLLENNQMWFQASPIMNQNQDPSCLNSAEGTLWSPDPMLLLDNTIFQELMIATSY